MRNRQSYGFTLIEISIVLVVIGLVTSGILVGRNLIRASEIRATVSQVEQMRTAVTTFRIKYNGLPGDLQDATIHWSETVNGNGDGVISVQAGSDIDGDGQPEYEYLRAAQHLSLAHLIHGSYTGTMPDPASRVYEVGTNVIPAKCCSRGGFVFWDNTTSVPKLLVAISPTGFNNSKFLVLGGIRNTNNLLSFNTAVITPVDAYAIDAKNDDGNPITGATLGLQTTHPSGLVYMFGWCTHTVALGVGAYSLLNEAEPACSMYFMLER